MLKARYYPDGLPARERARECSTGIALSGGGTRAVSCCIGALRGLTSLGLLPEIDYLSAVSGGGWAAGPYTYLPEHISDDEFLGPVVRPSELRWGPDSGPGAPGDLSYVPPKGLAHMPARVDVASMMGVAQTLLEGGKIPPGRVWARVCESVVLAPYDLGSTDPVSAGGRFLGHTREWLDRLLDELGEPGLAESDFVLYPTDRPRPFLIVNAALFKEGQVATQMAPFDITPLGTGVGPAPGEADGGSGVVGGGWLASFAYGAEEYSPVPESKIVELDEPALRFGLGDAMSATSAYFQDFKRDIDGAGGPSQLTPVVPTYPYASVVDLEAGRGDTRPLRLTDGGTMEITGVVALLRQGVDRIAAFINCQTPLSHDPETGQIVVDEQIPPLFGYQPFVEGQPYRTFDEELLKPWFVVYSKNQVFSSHAFEPLLSRLWESAQAGEGGVARQELETVANPDQLVTGGRPVRVVWVYNQPARRWSDALTEDVKRMIPLDPGLERFPNYDTTEDATLGPRQVNLLANLSCWKVMSGSWPNDDGPDHAGTFRWLFERGDG